MARIDSAYFGDDVGFRNITASIRNKISGGKLDVVANSELLPAFEAAPETTLKVEDEKKIRQQAVSTCGEADQKCLEATKAKLRQETLMERERTNMSSANIVKGRRLTVNVVDKNNKRRTFIVPDGQKFTLDNVDGSTVSPTGEPSLPSAKRLSERATQLLGWVGFAAVQVFGFTAFIMMVRDEFPAFWQRVLNGGWASVLAGAFASIFLFAIPLGPFGLVILYYLGKGIRDELIS